MSGSSSETMALIGLMGSVTGAMGSFYQGTESQNAYQYDAGLAMEQAQQVRQAEALHQTQMDLAKQKTVGMQHAEYAGRGVKANTGSPIDVMVNTLYNYNLDMAVSSYNSEVAARGLENKAAMDTYEGRMAKQSADTKGAMQLLSAGVELAVLFA